MKPFGRLQLGARALAAALALAGALASGCGSSTTTTTAPSSGASSGSMAVLTINGDTYAFVPSPTGVSKVKLASGGSLALTAGGAGPAATTAQGLTLTPIPDACAADYKNEKVVCASYTSDVIHVLDALAFTATSFPTGVTGSASFSGGSCMICGLLYDETDNKTIVSTAGGYRLFDHLGSHTFTKTIASHVAENFGYDPTTNRIFSPQYQSFPSSIDLIDVASGSIYSLTPEPATLGSPDHGAVDFGTGIAYSTEESGHTAYLVNIGGAQLGKPAAGQFQAATATVTITTSIGSRLTDVAVDSGAHYAFLNEEFGISMAVAKLPTSSGAALALGDYVVADVPNPPAAFWSGSGDPHGISNFTLSANGKHYGLLVDGSKSWLAIVDMDKLLAAPRNSGTHDLQTGYDLVAGGVVTFAQL